MLDFVLYQGSGEWSALYVNGLLAAYGDHYICEEHLHKLLQVEVIQSDDFMRGGDNGNDVAPSLIAIAEYRQLQRVALEKAAALRKQAETLNAQAELITKKWGK